MAGATHMNSETPGTIDPRVFIKQLAPDQLGVFEPLSGVMLLNISDIGFVELGERWAANQSIESDIAIIRTINHETYHFAQAAASGYVFHRQCRSFMAFNTSKPMPQVPMDSGFAALAEQARISIGDDPELKARYERTIAMLDGHRQFALLNERAAEGDNSMMGALMPGFFRHLQVLAEQERMQNADGLSITGVLEGSAVAHTNLLMHPNEDAGPYIEAELATLPPVYSELYTLATERTGVRALELLLPTVALALRYMQPHHAYGPLLALLAQSAPGEALDHGRSLITQLPEIADAGPVLGTALDLRQMEDAYRIYDTVLGKLATGQWDIDSYAFLAQPSAMHAVDSFPMGIITADGYRGGSMDKTELAARMAVMSAVLRVQSRRRVEREFREAQVECVSGILALLINRLDLPRDTELTAPPETTF